MPAEYTDRDLSSQYENLLLQHLDFDLNACGKAEVGEGFDCVRSAFGDVHYAGMSAHFELLAGVFVDESGFIDSEFIYSCRKGDRAGDN